MGEEVKITFAGPKPRNFCPSLELCGGTVLVGFLCMQENVLMENLTKFHVL